MLLPNWNAEVAVTTNPAINRPDVAAVVLNVTVTDSLQPGYISVTPAGANDPAVKAGPRQTSTSPGPRRPCRITPPCRSRPAASTSSLTGAAMCSPTSPATTSARLAASPFGAPQNVNPTPAGCVGFRYRPGGRDHVGSPPAAVANAQTRLRASATGISRVRRQLRGTTTQSVMAFQFLNSLPTTGKIDELTASRINTSLCVPSPSLGGGDYLEVDKGDQVLYIVRGGQTVWVIHVSTGGNYSYDEPNRKDPGARETGTAYTPTAFIPGLPGLRRGPLRRHARHDVSASLRRWRRGRPRGSERAELPGIAWLRSGDERGDGHDLGAELHADGQPRRHPRLIDQSTRTGDQAPV